MVSYLLQPLVPADLSLDRLSHTVLELPLALVELSLTQLCKNDLL